MITNWHYGLSTGVLYVHLPYEFWKGYGQHRPDHLGGKGRGVETALYVLAFDIHGWFPQADSGVLVPTYPK